MGREERAIDCNMNCRDNLSVLFYSHFFWPSIGGVETYVKLLAEGLALTNGIDITVITQTPIKIIEPKWPFSLHRCPKPYKLWSLIRNADVVLMAGPVLLPMVLSYLAGKPFLIEQHGYQAICPNGLLMNKHRGTICEGAFTKREYKECFRCLQVASGRFQSVRQVIFTIAKNYFSRRATRNIAVTNHVKNRHLLPLTEVVYHGIPDLNKVNHFCAKSDSQPQHFAYVGRLVEEKGLHLLIEAVKIIREQGLHCRVSLIGDGMLKEHLSKMIESLNLQDIISMTGFLTGPDLQREIESVDVVVMPSVWEETAGLSAMEHMMRGRVVIVANIGGLGEVVGDTGLKFHPFDAADLAEKMIKIILNPDLLERIGGSARERATACFQVSRMVKEHRELLVQASQATRSKTDRSKRSVQT